MLTNAVAGVLLAVAAAASGAIDAGAHGRSPADPTLSWPAVDCGQANPAALQYWAHDSSSILLRQSLCSHPEAPVMTLLIGEQRAVLLDTGARADRVPLRAQVDALLAAHPGPRELIVLHSHAHLDHVGGDSQLTERSGVTLIPATRSALQAFLGKDWPAQPARIELGGRTLTVLASPGHHPLALSIHDSQTGWLLTADSVYPGQIVIRDWSAYRSSIATLRAFAEHHRVSAIIGSHIERDRQGRAYRYGSRQHLDEAALALPPSVLTRLDAALQQMPQPRAVEMPELSVMPMSRAQRIVNAILRPFFG